MSVGSVVMAQLFIGQAQRQKSAEVRASYHNVRQMLIAAALDPIAILNSAKQGGKDSDLYKCAFIQDDPSNLSLKAQNCLHNANATPSSGMLPGYSLKLYRSSAANAPEITGRYNRDGGRCDNSKAASAECPFRLDASFVPECEEPEPGTTPSSSDLDLNPTLKEVSSGKCKRAARLQIHYRLTQDYGQPLPGIPVMPSFDTSLPDSEKTGYFPVGLLMENVLMPTCRVGFLVQGYDSTGKVICAQSPGNVMAACDTDRMLKQQFGGVTTKCDPNETYIKLVSSAKTISDCLTAGGKIVDKTSGALVPFTGGAQPKDKLTIDGTVVTASNHTSYQSKYFCKFSGGTSAAPVDCPTGWVGYNNWSETGARTGTVTMNYQSNIDQAMREECRDKIRDETTICKPPGGNRAAYTTTGNNLSPLNATSGSHTWSQSTATESVQKNKSVVWLRKSQSVPSGVPVCDFHPPDKYYFDCGNLFETLSSYKISVGCY